MIDIHTHLLPGTDAGCPGLSEARALLKKAVQDGITDMIITCHYDPSGGFHMEKKNLAERFELFRRSVNDIPVHLYLGNELFIHSRITELLFQGKCCSLAGSHYVLVEFPLEAYAAEYDSWIEHLQNNGYRVIIAHPERYDYISEESGMAERWRQMGCLLQCNASGFTDYSRNVHYLLKKNLVDFIASDAHDRRRPPLLTGAYDIVTERYGAARAEELFHDNPAKILHDLPWETE